MNWKYIVLIIIGSLIALNGLILLLLPKKSNEQIQKDIEDESYEMLNNKK